MAEQLQGSCVRIRLKRPSRDAWGDIEKLDGLVWYECGRPKSRAVLEQWNGREWQPVEMVQD